ncbi:MAG: cytochrome c [Armatimonadota bacterium]|nr:cytochrome c [Armatimonadota bacterium]MDR5702293.1 cytochrome c [Armatimonadota bacterium]MDR7436035.1 cytochrome c [Armatimonadota bacterium]
MGRAGIVVTGILLLLAVAAFATHWKAPQEARTLQNPIKATQASIAKGKELYMTYCAKCHGLKGLGDGPSVGSLRVQAGLNLTILGSESDGEIFWKISVGRAEMPPFELILTPEERWHLVNFIRTLKAR